MAHEMRGQNINVELIGTDVRKFLGDGGKSFVPERHGVNDAVRFRGGSHVRFSRARQIKRVAQDSVQTALREDGLLQSHLVVGAAENSAADVGVFAFIVFAN